MLSDFFDYMRKPAERSNLKDFALLADVMRVVNNVTQLYKALKNVEAFEKFGALSGGVSYGLAFATAFRARRVKYERAGLVLRLVLKRFMRRPHDFVWPRRAQRT